MIGRRFESLRSPLGDSIVETVAAAKHSRVARAAMLPLMNVQFAKRDWAYAKSRDAKMIRDLEGSHEGERCFIVGNGPSLTTDDLEAISGEVTFAANRIFNVFDETTWRPTYYIATDREFIAQESGRLQSIATAAAFINLTPFSERLSGLGSVVLINKRPKYFSTRKYTTDVITFSDRPWEYVSEGYTVTYQALQLAVHMGFREIYLIGMDHRYGVWADSHGAIHSASGIVSHCYVDKPGEHLNPFYVEGVEFAYRVADIAARQRGARIYNATRGGSLEIFERIDLDGVLENIKAERKGI